MIRLLYIGHFYNGSTEHARLSDLKRDFVVDTIDLSILFPLWKRSFSRSFFHSIGYGPPFTILHSSILYKLSTFNFDAILLEKNLYLSASFVSYLKSTFDVKIILFLHDNISISANHNRHLLQSLPCMNLILSTKSTNIDFIKSINSNTLLIPNSVAVSDLSLLELSDYPSSFRYDISFVGRYETERGHFFLSLIDKYPNLRFALLGPGWPLVSSLNTFPNVFVNDGVWGDAYSSFVANSFISFGLLSYVAGDTITTRTLEVPAFGGFLLSPRTQDTLALFGQDFSPFMFDTIDDAIDIINLFLSNASLRNSCALHQLNSIRSKGLFWQTQINQNITSLF